MQCSAMERQREFCSEAGLNAPFYINYYWVHIGDIPWPLFITGLWKLGLCLAHSTKQTVKYIHINPCCVWRDFLWACSSQPNIQRWKSTQVEVLQQWYAFHWIQFSFNLNTFKLQLKVSTLTSQFHFQTHHAWIQSQNNTKRLTALMLSDCADDVFIEIRQVCDKIFTFFDSSVLQADVMRLPCRQQTELATMWHQGCFDLLLVQFRAPILVDMNLPVQILCSTAWFWVRTELFVDLINLHNNSLM